MESTYAGQARATSTSGGQNHAGFAEFCKSITKNQKFLLTDSIAPKPNSLHP